MVTLAKYNTNSYNNKQSTNNNNNKSTFKNQYYRLGPHENESFCFFIVSN